MLWKVHSSLVHSRSIKKNEKSTTPRSKVDQTITLLAWSEKICFKLSQRHSVTWPGQAFSPHFPQFPYANFGIVFLSHWGGLEYLYHSPVSCRRRRKGNPVPGGYNCANLLLEDMKRRTWSSRLWVELKVWKLNGQGLVEPSNEGYVLRSFVLQGIQGYIFLSLWEFIFALTNFHDIISKTYFDCIRFRDAK
jgi:hypothetical protein